MDSLVVLIAAPGSGAITPQIVEAIRDNGGTSFHWLSPREALEVENFPNLPQVLGELGSHPIDAAVIPAQNRRKKLLVADMDSTMIRQECIDELGVVAGVGERIADITRRAMRGELDFEAALLERVGLLKDLDASVIDKILAEKITFMPGGKTLLATMKANKAYTALISGGFTAFTSHVAAALGFHEHKANTLLIENGKLTGDVARPILGQQAKLDGLLRLAKLHGLGPSDTIAVGDGANDLPMLLAAGMGVALHAKPHVQEKSKIRINHADLTALLYLQGYRREQFVNL